MGIVDRLEELQQLVETVSRGMRFPLIVYGPEGCGKSALVRELVRVMDSRGWLSIYVDAVEEFSAERAMDPSTPVAKEIGERIAERCASGVGLMLARRVLQIAAQALELGEWRGVLIVVDDPFRVMDLRESERYVKSLYEWVSYMVERFGIDRVSIVLTSAVGTALQRLGLHSFASVSMLWNMRREGFEQFLESLSPPKTLSADTLWSLVGGNPRAAIEIASMDWNPYAWLRRVYETRVKRAAHLVGREALETLAQDPDAMWVAAARLEELGLMISLSRSSSIGWVPEKDPEMGIGEEWAWQLPAYRIAVVKYLLGL